MLSRILRPGSRTLLGASANSSRAFGTASRFLESQDSKYGAIQKDREVNPRVSPRASTHESQETVPRVGVRNSPPELLSSVEPEWAAQSGGVVHHPAENIELRIPPIKRTGESDDTMRARLLYQSRKRGILETDLLLSTFAEANLNDMPRPLLEQYDSFLDEHDWDIYYWATQHGPSTSAEYAEGAAPAAEVSTTSSAGRTPQEAEYGKDEWANTVGKTKAPFRKVPEKWRDSEILKLIRQHVEERKAGGSGEGKGLGRMPPL